MAHPDVDRARSEISAELNGGDVSLWIALGADARQGRDPDDPDATFGGGVLVWRVDDLERLLEAFDRTRVPLNVDAGASALPATALLVAAVERGGATAAALRGTLGCDPLGALAADGRLPASLDSSLQQMADLARWSRSRAPGLRAVLVSGLPYHEAGATAAQELAFSLATGIEYLRALSARGLTVPQAAGQLTFALSAGRDVFLEIAKLRAARQTWSRVLEACDAEEAGPMRLRAVTSGRTKTIGDPWVNIVRGAVESFSAAVGGAEAITVTPFDSTIGPPDELGRRVARNTQLVLLEESHLDRVIDPAGGSWYIESLTADLARSAWSILGDIERDGGMAAALRGGAARALVEEAADRRAAAVAEHRLQITGTSAQSGDAIERPPIDLAELGERHRVAAIAHKRRRSAADATAELARICRADDSSASLTEAAIEAARAGATLGQISSLLAGSAPPESIEPLAPRRDAALLEREIERRPKVAGAVRPAGVDAREEVER